MSGSLVHPLARARGAGGGGDVGGWLGRATEGFERAEAARRRAAGQGEPLNLQELVEAYAEITPIFGVLGAREAPPPAAPSTAPTISLREILPRASLCARPAAEKLPHLCCGNMC